MFVHITLYCFRAGVDPEVTRAELRRRLAGQAGACAMAPHDAEARRSWHCCMTAEAPTEAALEKVLGGAAWRSALEHATGLCEVQKGWTFRGGS